MEFKIGFKIEFEIGLGIEIEFKIGFKIRFEIRFGIEIGLGIEFKIGIRSTFRHWSLAPPFATALAMTSVRLRAHACACETSQPSPKKSLHTTDKHPKST